MLKHTFTFLMILLCTALTAITGVPGSGTNVADNADRDFHFAYHTGADDYRFYGTDTWAVRFNFASAYADADTCRFTIRSAQLWLPQVGDSVRVELFSDVMGLPGQRLARKSAPVTQNLMTLTFDDEVTAEVAWMIVYYTTHFANRFVSASAGGGTRSFYLNTNATTPYFQSFANAGFAAELLFGVTGDFQISGVDLQLQDFGFTGMIEPRQAVYPSFSVYNHSSLPLSDARVNILITSPLTSYTISDQINIQETIAPFSQYTWTDQSIGYAEHRYELAEAPMQFKARAVLSSSTIGNDLAGNNTITKYFYSFSDAMPVKLVENFFRHNFAAGILGIQDQYLIPGFDQLTYFPVLSDSLGNQAAMTRFNWYRFNSTPITAVNGTQRVNGYTTAYPQMFQTALQGAGADRSFISSAECRFDTLGPDAVNASITISNAGTHLFTNPAEYNLMANSRWFVGLFRSVVLGGNTRWVPVRWITQNETLTGNLNAGESINKVHRIMLTGLDFQQSYRLYYWLQVKDGGRILYANWETVNPVVSVDDELLQSPVISIGPNPLKGMRQLNIDLDTDDKSIATEVFVYNARGQRIWTFSGSQPRISIPSHIFPSSGIYMLRIRDSRSGGRGSTHKITVIK